MLQFLKNQVAIVTGGTSGIGKEIALKFAEHGASVAIFGTNQERANQVLEEMSQRSPEAKGLFFQVDVSDTSAVEEIISRTEKELGSVSILVNNAGITRDQLLMRMTESDWDDVIGINVKSCYNTSRALIRNMMKSRRGKIINMSSVVGLIGNAGQVNYAASKAAVIGFTKALAKEVAGRQICVNCIAPGFIDTKMTGALSEAQKENTLSQIPFNRMGTPEDVANAALFLAGPWSDYITGQVLTVDGGLAI